MRLSYYELDNGSRPPRWYRFSYTDFMRAFDVFYPMPINRFVRYGRRIYWKVLRAFYWVGLIDVGIAECFHWGSFYRIKSH